MERGQGRHDREGMNKVYPLGQDEA